MMQKITENSSGKTKEMVTRSKDKVVTTMDVNGDGHVDIEDVMYHLSLVVIN